MKICSNHILKIDNSSKFEIIQAFSCWNGIAGQAEVISLVMGNI